MPDRPPAEGSLRTDLEKEARNDLASAFERSSDDIATRLDEFPKYVRRQVVTRFLALSDLFRESLETKGSIVNCGVFRGFSLMAFAHLSAVLEPTNLTRRIYGFDTFAGFPTPGEKDRGASGVPQNGDLGADVRLELETLAHAHDCNRPLGHIPKVHLIQGDATVTIPQFVKDTPHLVVSLLFLDFDLYAPTKAALEHFLPRMPKGALVAFDELDNPLWPGETLAAIEAVGLGNLRLRRFPYDPYIGFARIGE